MRSDRPQRPQTMAAAYGLHLLEITSRFGVADEDVLRGSGLTRADLANPERSLPIDEALRIHERALALTGEPALGIFLGMRMNASAHGMVGFAAMTSGRVRDAVRTSVHYTALRTTALSLTTQLTEEGGALVLVENADLGPSRELFILGILIGFWRMGTALAARNFDVALDVAFARPDYYARFEHLLPPTRFGQPANQLVLRDLSFLELPIAMADEAAFSVARAQCDELLRGLGLDGQLAPRVRAILARNDREVAALKDVAKSLHMSTRTLRRRLEGENVMFSALVDDERLRRALLLLRSQELTVEEVGERLGYTHVGNFTRAFRRWTGKTPSAYRSSSS